MHVISMMFCYTLYIISGLLPKQPILTMKLSTKKKVRYYPIIFQLTGVGGFGVVGVMFPDNIP